MKTGKTENKFEQELRKELHIEAWGENIDTLVLCKNITDVFEPLGVDSNVVLFR